MSKGFVTDLGFPFDFETSTEKLDSKSRALGLNWFFIFACCFYQVSLYNQVCRGGAAVLTKILINIPTNFCNRSELTKSKRNCDFDVLPFPDNSGFPPQPSSLYKKDFSRESLTYGFCTQETSVLRLFISVLLSDSVHNRRRIFPKVFFPRPLHG